MNGPASTDPAWLDQQYDPRLPDRPMPAIIGEWLERTVRARTTHRPETVDYGPGEGERLDLYRAASPRGTMIFYHGGYWRSCSKEDHGWIAKPFVDHGVSVAVMDYPLCPAAALEQILGGVRRAFDTLQGGVLSEQERRRIVCAGHSAGGHMAAAHLTRELGVVPAPGVTIGGVVALSGLFDLGPLVPTLMNGWLRLDAGAADALSVANKEPAVAAPLVLAVGGAESGEFHRQSSMLANRWVGLDADVLNVKGRNHFDLLDDFADPGHRLFRRVVELFG
jgi:arylformamidase